MQTPTFNSGSELTKLHALAKAYGLPAEFGGDNIMGWLEINTPKVAITIQRRPHYCDRGRWLVQVSSHDDRRLCIDWADGFPRYYFHTEVVMAEVFAWMNARSLWPIGETA